MFRLLRSALVLPLIHQAQRRAVRAPRGFCKARLDLTELSAGRGQRILAFSQPPRQPCGFVQRLIDAICR
jgi:hypothetical protein